MPKLEVYGITQNAVGNVMNKKVKAKRFNIHIEHIKPKNKSTWA